MGHLLHCGHRGHPWRTHIVPHRRVEQRRGHRAVAGVGGRGRAAAGARQGQPRRDRFLAEAGAQPVHRALGLAETGEARVEEGGVVLFAEGDVDNDGYPDYALTSMGDTKLQFLDREFEDAPTYRDEAYERGATAHRPYVRDAGKPSTGWHAGFADFNNDTALDLFIAKGNVEAMPDFAADDPDNLLMGGFDGRFTEVGGEAGIALPTKGRGALLADFNLDGATDLLVVNRGEKASLFRNLGGKADFGTRPLGNFVAVKLAQAGANRDAIGAKLAVKIGAKTLNRTLRVGGGHASGTSGFVHVGLGTAERAEIRVQWPDGEWSHPYRVFADNFVLIDRGTDAARYWYPDADRPEPPAPQSTAASRPAARVTAQP